jgi:ribosomal protein S21
MKENNDKRSGKRNNFMPRKEGDTQAVAAVTVSDDKFPKIEAVQAKPLEVKVYGNFDKALRAFRALVQKERVLSSYKEKRSYEKPSDKHRRKRNEAKRKLLEMCTKNYCDDPKHHHRGNKHAFME